MRTWRFLITPPASGAWNMAVDEAIATHAGRGDVPPTLRFYQWQPASVSLGRHQPLADIDLARCRSLGYDVVRRATGGRAILHTDELTYSVAGPQDNPVLAGAVLDSYLRLSQGLLAGLARLGLVGHEGAADQPVGRGRRPGVLRGAERVRDRCRRQEARRQRAEPAAGLGPAARHVAAGRRRDATGGCGGRGR